MPAKRFTGYWLPRHLVAFRRSHPGVAIRLSMVNTSQAAAAVRGGEADLGFVEGEVDDPALVSETVARDQLVIVIGAEHSWGEAKGLGKVDLLDVDWVLREPGSGTRSGFEHALGALSLSLHELRVALELPSNEAVRAAVEAGMGAAVMSASVAAPSIEAGLLRQVNFVLPERCYYALRHAERYRSRAAETLMDIIRGSGPGLG
jgi:DNA-binding transcriptional LysR family regulator